MSRRPADIISIFKTSESIHTSQLLLIKMFAQWRCKCWKLLKFKCVIVRIAYYTFVLNFLHNFINKIEVTFRWHKRRTGRQIHNSWRLFTVCIHAVCSVRILRSIGFFVVFLTCLGLSLLALTFTHRYSLDTSASSALKSLSRFCWLQLTV